MNVSFQYPEKVWNAWEHTPNARFRLIFGPRGKSATTCFSQKMIEKSFEKIGGAGLCTRHIQKAHDLSTKRSLEKAIKQCVHLYMDRVEETEQYRRVKRCRLHNKGCPGYCTDKETLAPCFEILNNEIRNKLSGFTIHFNGLSKVTENEAKGAEDFDYIWISEAHSVPLSSLQKFLPSMREEGSEVWFDWNPENADDSPAVYFLEDPTVWPPIARTLRGGVMAVFLMYEDNPFFSAILEDNMEEDREVYSPEDWDWIWLGKLKQSLERYIFNAKAVRSAMNRSISYPLTGTTVVACDAAHMGGDEIVIGRRVGNQVTDMLSYRGMATYETREKIEELAGYDKTIPIVIDNGHVGAAIADELQKEGYFVYRVDFGGGKKSFRGWETEPKSKNITTDMKRYLNSKLEKEELVLPNDPELYKQMTERRASFVRGESGIFIVEGKEDFAKHYTGKSKSPDRSDMIELLFYRGDNHKIWDGRTAV